MAELTPCIYGSSCYRKNPAHFKQFSHPADTLTDIRRAEKRSSDPGKNSPEPSTSKRHKPGFVDNKYGIYLSTVNDIEDHWNDPSVAISISDILHIDAHEFVESAQFNFMIDLEWLMQQYPASSRDKPLMLISSSKSNEWDLLRDLMASRYNHVTLHDVPLTIRFGSHHTKMMLLRYSSGVRVVIHTANLVPSDWDKKTQGIWISPKMIFPPPDASGPVPTSFQQDLMQYLAAYRLPALNRWIDLLRTVDASGVRVELVGSVPSRADSKLVSDSWGLWKLRKLLSSHGTKPSCSSKQVVVGQFSSIGSLKDNPGAWVEGELLSAMCPQRSRLGPSSSGSNVTADIKFIYPCVENVRMCLEGYEGGGSLPYLQSVASKQPWLNKMLHKWSSDTFGRTVAIPHIKTYASFDSDFGKLSWFLLTSANLSQAAWGSVTKKDSTLFIRSYELGVLFLPSRFIWLKLFQNEEYFKPTTFPVPYDLPPIPYGSNDSPWIFDTPKERPDRFGRVFARR